MSQPHPSRQVLRHAAIRAQKMQVSTQRLLRRSGRGLSLSPLAWLVGGLMAGPAAYANPSGAQVVGGSAVISSPTPGTLQIIQSSDKAVLNWRNFSIGAGETVNFQQPSSRSVVLNRVVGSEPSSIFGRMTANGTVMLVNPNGILFGPTARVDVGGLVATTANLRNEDFMAGRYAFGEASPRLGATVENQGQITIGASGLAALVAPRVRNTGVIEARLGRVMLGAANAFTLDFHGDGLLSFNVGSAVTEAQSRELGALVVNGGTLRADGGTVLLTAQAVKAVVDQVINTSGIVTASTVENRGGQIVLSGGTSGAVAVSGSLHAASDNGAGGRVVVTGQHVTVGSTARIDASGTTGGGEIALGSTGMSSAGNHFADKSATLDVLAGAQLSANALTLGNGGNITLWSTDRTRFAGALSATGGAQGGHGGFAEVSSLKDIALVGAVDLRAARGRTGSLLIDPTDLRITDSASGGSLDGNAADANVAAGDANQGSGNALNTVSRGLLESLSGTANITLQATGQITVDPMAGGLINLATTAGRSFTLQSTQSGGIRFGDAATEIRTQGGNITLQASGPSGTLSNIGKLTSNGGNITLQATGDIQLAGAIAAGSAGLRLQTTVGSIANAPSATPVLSASTIHLSAPSGHVGTAGRAINTQTGNLTVATGGHLVVSNATALTHLNLSAGHVATTDANDYQITAPGLTFQATDGSAVTLTQVNQTGLNLQVSADRSLQLGSLNVGAGALTLRTTGGNLLGSANTALTAASLILTAHGASGNDGAIGSSAQPLLTAAGSLDAIAGSGGVNLTNNGAIAISRLSTTGNSSINATGTITAGNVSAGSATLAINSSAGSVLDDGSDSTRISAGTLNLTAGAAIGASGTPVSTNAGSISANAAVGGIYASALATNSVLSSIVSGNGAIDIRTGGSTTLTSLTSSTSAAGNSITVAATGTGSLSVGTVNAGALGNVSLSTTSGSITGNTGLITGNTVTLNAANSGAVSVRTAASQLDVQAGSGSISITQTGPVTLDRISTPSTVASVTSSSGDITVGSVSTSRSGQVSLTASAGAILDDGNSATRISTGTASLNASGAIGSASHAVQTQATGLAVTNTGNLFITNTDATLTSLSITNRHNVAGALNTLQVTSPYLVFDVTDDGTQYALNRLVSVPLGSLAFSGDQSLRIGQVQAAGSVNLNATQGHIVDDGNLNSRVTAGSTLTLSAAQGSVGSAASPIATNANSLALTTRGDLYISNLSDLSTLTIASSHADTSTSYGMAITAPSLRLAVTDSAAGHAVQTLTDNSSLSLTFTSDRDITLGQVDVTHTGIARFTSSAGAIKDDGNKSTRVLANSVTLSGSAVGAAGTDYMDVIAGTLAATASAGGVYVQLPMPTGSTNTTSTVNLGTVSATGSVSITALEGDLSLAGFLTATNQAVSLTATQGSILSPSGYSISIGTGSLTLQAARSIGSSGNALPVTSSSGATLSAQAGTSMWLSSSGAMSLSSLEAATGITYTQSSGAITVGHVDATAGGTVSITATSGAIQDDSDAATGIRANQVTLNAAQGSIGSSTAVAVDTPKLLVTALGAVNVSNSATLDTLSLTRGSGSSGSIAISSVAGQSFTISEDSTAHYVEAVGSSTPLAFSFSGQRGVKIGHIDVGSTGSASISSAASLTNDGVLGSSIAAGTVTLTAGSAGSIGATGSGNAISLEGTTSLTLSTGRDAFVASDTALTDLTVTSTNTTTAVGTASVFNLSGLNQTFGITDSGTTQSLDFTGTALTNASFTSRKNIVVGAITATGDVTLSTSGGGANSNISSASGSGRITGNRVLLTAISTTAGGGSIGSSGTPLRVDTPTLILAGSGNVQVDDAQNLARLEMTLSHGTNTTFSYGVTAGNLNSFTITDGNTQSLGMAVSGSMDFVYSVDRALSLATIDAGTSTTGSIALTSRSAPAGTGAQINRSSGSLTGGSITLSATGTNGGVGAGATLSTNTKNLSIATGGNVSVSNSTTLTSLTLDARHNTSGSSTHSYSISSTGLTFSISDTLGNNAFQLSNITQSSLDLSVKADRVITASSVNTGAGGKVTLHSGSYVQGGSGASAGSPSITTGDLTLNGGSAFGYQGSTPLYTSAGTLSSSLSNTLYLSNAGALMLKANTVGSSADIASSNSSLLQGVGGLFTTPTLKLSANQSLGSNATLLTDARRLTLVARNHIDVGNASDLYALTIISTHGTVGVQNTVSVAAPRLMLTLNDSVGGNQYHLSNLVDNTGLDFTLSTDVDLSLGTVNAQAGRSLALYSTGSGTAITNNGSSQISAGSITLSAGGSVGAAGSSGTRMQTNALTLALATGADAYVDNAQDLSSLSLSSSQSAGGTTPIYQVSAPALTFNVTDDGTTRVNNVIDSTGLNFVLDTRRNQAIATIDVGRSGTVSLTSTGDILGDADTSRRIAAASLTAYANNGGAVGSVSNPIRVSAPLVSLAPTGALNVESDTHIDQLTISTTHPTAAYGGIYSIASVPITGSAYSLLTATDSVTGTALTSLNAPLGLAFSFTSDGPMQVGGLNLGTTGTVTLTGTGSGGIVDDGNPSTRVQAASLSMTSYGGAIGAAGSGNGIDATANTVSATAQGGGVNLALQGRTMLGTISATGGVNLTNGAGDIALGVIDAGGNAVSINNQGGSILSGSIANATTVSLTASGSIGNTSAIGTSANGGGTTTLTASASAAHGASGSIALSESYNLAAATVTAPGNITLDSGYGLAAGTLTSGGQVDLSSSQGSITGINGSNSITGTSVNLSARYGTGNGIGSSSTRLNLNAPQLVLNTPGSVYLTNSADLSLLTIDRTNYTGTGSNGTLSVIASGLTLAATDSSNTTTLTTLSDSTGLDFNYLGIGSLAIGSVNVGSGTVLLQGYLSSGDGNIHAVNSSSLITAGRLTLEAYGTGSTIGSSATPLGLAVGSLTASSGTGGIALRQTGTLTLSNLNTSGDLSVTASSGDLWLGTLSYGTAKTLSLTASAGSIFAGGGTLTGGGASAAMTLSAANGIGTTTAPILVNGSAGHTLSANVTGAGSLYLSSLGTLNGGLSTLVSNGSTTVTAAGAIKLTALSSGTDATGNDIRITASAGDITAVSVSGGGASQFNGIFLAANAGRLLAAPGATLEGFEVQLHGATGVGTATDRVSTNGQRVQVSSAGGAIYLSAAAPSALSSVQSNGGAIDIVHSADLLLANASSGGGNITVASTAANTSLTIGNMNAGSGALTLSASGNGSTLRDDGNRSTWARAGSASLTGAAGVGSSSLSVQTSAATLSVSSGNGIYIQDHRSAGVNLNSVVASAGAVSVQSAGPTTATRVQAGTDSAGNDVTLTTSSGDLTVLSVEAGANQGRVNLSAAGSILATGNGPQVIGRSASLHAGDDVGAVSNLATGAGTPVQLNVRSITALGTSGTNRVVSVLNTSTAAMSLDAGALSLGSGSSAYIATGGDFDASAGITLAQGNLSLTAGANLVLPTTAINTTGSVRLVGTTDILTQGIGAAARQLRVQGSSLRLSSGAAGGNTQLITAVGNIEASLIGTGNLSVMNTGALSGTTLSTANGDITLTNSAGLSIDSVVAGGTGRSISLTASTGQLSVGTVNAGSGGSITLAATQGALSGSSAALTANTLELISGSGIGSSNAAFALTVPNVRAQVTGVGGIHLSSGSDLNVSQLATQDGDARITTAGHLTVGAMTIGQSGNLALTSTGGNVTLTQTYTQNGSDASRASVRLEGQSIDVGALATTGSQSYIGALTVRGDLTASSLSMVGPVTLSGASRTLTGELTVDGTLTGGGGAATVHAGSRSVVLTGSVNGLSALTITGATIQTAGVSTTGAQTYQGATTLRGNYTGSLSVTGATQVAAATTVVTNGGAASFSATVDGASALSINAGAGGVSFSGAVGATQALSSLSVTGASSLGGSVRTTGGQSYGGATTLVGHTTLQGVGVTFNGTLDGAGDLLINAGNGAVQFNAAVGATTALGALSINSGADTRFAASVRAGAINTDAAGSLTIDGGSMTTSGAQTYGERVLLGATTTLSGTTVTLNGGADASTAGSQGLSVVGNAVLNGDVGGQQSLQSLSVSSSAVVSGNVTSNLDQSYGGPVSINSDAVLRSLAGSLLFSGTIDSPSARQLVLRADAGSIDVVGAVGSNSALGTLSLLGGNTTNFGSSVTAGQIGQNGGGLTRFDGRLRATNPGGLALSARGLQMADSVTADTGAITLIITDASGTVNFATGGAVRAATAFVQAGGAAVQLPQNLEVVQGPISIQAPSASTAAVLNLSTNGTISMAGLNAPQSVVHMNAGSGALNVGSANSSAALSLTVQQLRVDKASSASLYGSIGGQSGAAAASRITSPLFGAPYFMNGTPWGPIDIIAAITATTVPTTVVASSPSLSPLFTGALSPGDFAPNALQAYRPEALLTIAPLPMNIAPVTRPGSLFLPTPGREREDLNQGR